ncbi:MAG TPA: methionine--tRNA ligase [Candidatus Nitrosocosmicus sp.]|nr:methionine--tRNA ligase [Candidatus Nitrosocosmicus sp.]
MSEIKDEITYDDFSKIDLKVGKVLNAEQLEGYKKILKLEVDIGERKIEIMSGLAKHYVPGEIVGKNVIVCTNLAPRKFGEKTSNGMLLAATNEDGKPIPLTVLSDTRAGSPIT